MKKTNFSTLTITLIMLTLICLIGISGIFAKYTTTLTGSGQAKIAKWAFSAKDGVNTLSDTFTITLTDQTSNGYIQPGSKGTILITIDNSGSDVAANLSVTATAATLSNKQITIKTPVKQGTQDAVTTIDKGEIVNVEIPWEWNYEVDDETTSNITDSTDTTSGSNATTSPVPVIDLTITGTQVAL